MRDKNEKSYLRQRKTTDKICGFNIDKLFQRSTSLSKQKLNVNHFTISRRRSFHNCFRNCWMRVNRLNDLVTSRF